MELISGKRLSPGCLRHWTLIWEAHLMEWLGLSMPEDLEERWAAAAGGGR